MTGHLLLIEDNESLGASLVDNFQMESYTVDWVQDGRQGLHAALKNIHDVIILDLNLPSLDGLEILKEVRKKLQTPIIILSARGQTHDKIAGLELKADDYVSKPFHFKELSLRVQNLLRRIQNTNDVAVTKINIGKAKFDFDKMEVSHHEGTEKLTDKQARVLKLLITCANQVVSRDKMMDLVWGMSNYPSTRTIDNIIVEFRKWIEIDPQNPEHIISHRGIGYLLKIKESE